MWDSVTEALVSTIASQFNIATFNINNELSTNLPYIKEFVIENKIDFVCLQEIYSYDSILNKVINP